jgi:NitT/TauT family transport system ATP-binding protein
MDGEVLVGANAHPEELSISVGSISSTRFLRRVPWISMRRSSAPGLSGRVRTVDRRSGDRRAEHDRFVIEEDRLQLLPSLQLPSSDGKRMTLEPRPVDSSSPGASRPALSFDRVSMIYPDGTVALRDVTLAVKAGEITSVVGPSGCGKSTLLRIASGIVSATAGAVSVEADRLGFVFQDATLLPWRTVVGNVELLLELHGMPSDERRERALEAIAAVGLEGFEMHHPKQLSGGMKMRVSLARWLALEPSVFLFDEPFGALDEITRDRLNDELLKLFQKRGFSALFVTHSVFEAVFVSSRVLVMSSRPGRIVADIEVPLGYPRSEELRFDPAVSEIAGQVSAALRGLW